MPLKTLAVDENDAELIRSMQRQQHIDAELLTDANVRFEQPLEKNTYVLSEDETPCTRVNYLSLDDKTERTFSFLPSVLMKEIAFKTGMCLGSNNLSKLQKSRATDTDRAWLPHFPSYYPTTEYGFGNSEITGISRQNRGYPL